MSDMAAAIRAAKEVQADLNATEYFRVAEELAFKAKQEYRYKNFARAKTFANQAREAAEKAEFISIRGGASRTSLSAPPTDEGVTLPPPNEPQSAPPAEPTPSNSPPSSSNLSSDSPPAAPTP
jgi:hypothetical protein